MSEPLKNACNEDIENITSDLDSAIKERNEVTGYFDIKLKEPLFDKAVHRLCSKLKVIQAKNKELNKIISDFDKRHRYSNT